MTPTGPVFVGTSTQPSSPTRLARRRAYADVPVSPEGSTRGPTSRRDAAGCCLEADSALRRRRRRLSPVARRSPLGLADDLVGEEGEAVTDGPGVQEAHALLVAGLLEEALAGPERDWVDHQP